MSQPATILLVEDDRMDVELTLDAFREAKISCAVHVCLNGEQALAYLLGQDEFADRARFPLPNLVLLDLKLPGLDGFEVLRRVKATSGLRRIPVVILTSSKQEGDRAMGYDSGANSYLVKPLSFEGFLQVVRALEEYWLTLNAAPPMGAGTHGVSA